MYNSIDESTIIVSEDFFFFDSIAARVFTRISDFFFFTFLYLHLNFFFCVIPYCRRFKWPRIWAKQIKRTIKTFVVCAHAYIYALVLLAYEQFQYELLLKIILINTSAEVESYPLTSFIIIQLPPITHNIFRHFNISSLSTRVSY